jgi:hypothetical protein
MEDVCMSVPMRWERRIEPISPPAAPPLRRRKPRRARVLRTALIWIGCLGLLGSVAVGVHSMAFNASAPSLLRLARVAPSRGQVVMGAAQAERRLGFVTVTGSVTNRSRSAQPRVEAVVELLDRRNQTVQVESSLLDFDPLGVGDSAPFRVELPDDTHAVAYRIRFRRLLGPRLD